MIKLPYSQPRKNIAKPGGRQASFPVKVAVCKHPNGFRRAGTGYGKKVRFQCRFCAMRIINPVAVGSWISYTGTST